MIKTGKIIICQTCNKEFYIPKNRINSAKFCSHYCRGASAMKRFKKNCEICNKEFEFIHVRKDRAKYCSRKCYYKAQHLKGTIKYECQFCNKLFRSSPSHKRKFCSKKCVNNAKISVFDKPTFQTVRKYMAKRNLINQCQKCGFKKYKKILGIHHKDKNRNNNSLDNLVVLCPNCHSIEHIKHIII